MSNPDLHITDRPIDTNMVISLVSTPSQGGLNVFIGNVRNRTKGKKVVRLEYEAYNPMALAEMEKIAEKTKQQWPQSHIAIYHRIGILEVGEAAVVIAVSTPHRAQAFAACQFAIDTLKETVPIWKKEVFEDGAIWVAAHP